VTENYDSATGHHETEQGVCAICGETAIRPYLCGVHADEFAAEALEEAWWNAIHPPNDDQRHWAEMEQWHAELTAQQEAA
jgi:hypothetical protein